MPLTKSLIDPFSLDLLPQAYVRCYKFELDFKEKKGTFYFAIFRSEAAWAAGKEPISSFLFKLTPDGRPAQYGEPPIITPGVPAVEAVYGPNGEVLVQGVPQVPAVYGEPELIAPAFPSFDQAVVQNQDAYNALALAINTLAKLYDTTLIDFTEE